jgi:hypothetical protein
MTAPDLGVPSADNAPDTPALEVIADDIPCAKCEYNLRGLSVSGRCPECALVVVASLPTRQELSSHDWGLVRDSLGLVLVANCGILLLAASFALVMMLSSDLRIPLWPLVVPLAVLVVVRARGYTRFAAVLRPLGRSYAEWDACNTIRVLTNTRAALGCIPLSFAMARSVLSPSAMASLFPVVGFIAFVLYCCAGGFQYSAVAYALTVLGFRSRTRRLGRSVATHTLVCALGVFPGALLFGLGLIFTWLSYHLLLARFARAAHRFAATDA